MNIDSYYLLIEAAYKKHALESHPGKSGTTQAFRAVNEAADKISGNFRDLLYRYPSLKEERVACEMVAMEGAVGLLALATMWARRYHDYREHFPRVL